VVLFIPSILSTFALTMVGRQAITYILPKFFGIPFDVFLRGTGSSRPCLC
jgi:hypothetical protein